VISIRLSINHPRQNAREQFIAVETRPYFRGINPATWRPHSRAISLGQSRYSRDGKIRRTNGANFFHKLGEEESRKYFGKAVQARNPRHRESEI